MGLRAENVRPAPEKFSDVKTTVLLSLMRITVFWKQNWISMGREHLVWRESMMKAMEAAGSVLQQGTEGWLVNMVTVSSLHKDVGPDPAFG